MDMSHIQLSPGNIDAHTYTVIHKSKYFGDGLETIYSSWKRIVDKSVYFVDFSNFLHFQAAEISRTMLVVQNSCKKPEVAVLIFCLILFRHIYNVIAIFPWLNSRRLSFYLNFSLVVLFCFYRLKMSISLPGSTVHGSQPQSLFPTYVLLVKPITYMADTQVIMCYIVASSIAVCTILLTQFSA